MTYAMSDLHGEHDKYKKMLEKIETLCYNDINYDFV